MERTFPDTFGAWRIAAGEKTEEGAESELSPFFFHFLVVERFVGAAAFCFGAILPEW